MALFDKLNQVAKNIGDKTSDAIEATELANKTAEQIDQAAQANDAAVMAEWNEKLPQYPKWSCGGTDYRIENDGEYYWFYAHFDNHVEAEAAWNQYRALVKQSGFRPAGANTNDYHFYKMVDGIYYHCGFENFFENDSNTPTIYFDTDEPEGGFDYVKPEPKKPASFKDLFKL